MRKYFLLTAAALMISGTANAEDIAGTVEVNATIKNVTKLSCTSLDFGEILLPVNNVESSVRIPADEFELFLGEGRLTTGDAVLSGDINPASCDAISALTFEGEFSTPNNLQLPLIETLTHSNGKDVLGLGHFEAAVINSFGDEDFNIGATLTIPANAPAGKYTGSFPIIITVE